MQRRREVAAAPERSAGQAWDAVSALLRDTLLSSAHVDEAEVDRALSVARSSGLALIAGGHLDREPLVLVGAPVHLSITTVSGDRALTLEENSSVPGGASIEGWTLYLPTPEPLSASVRATAASHSRLSASEPPSDAEQSAKATSFLDRGALARRAPEA
jgi:hypothetical protein